MYKYRLYNTSTTCTDVKKSASERCRTLKIHQIRGLYSANKVKINRIKEVLAEQKRSQAWLAREVGKSKNAMNSFCNNRSQPNVKLLHQIALLLDVDIRDLLYPTK